MSDVTPVNLEPAEPRRPRRRLGMVVAAGGVAAVLAVGALAVGSLVGNGGGSDSPEGAVRQLAAAVSDQDPLAAADVLAPDEVRSLRGTVDAAEKRAQELTLVKTASAPLAGLDLSVDDLKLSTESLGDGYAKVIVNGGTISARTDKPQFSPLVQRALRGTGDNSAHADLATLAHDSGLPTFVVTVQREGHWYVSAAYTTLEYVREVNHLPAADFGSGLQAAATLGADSPDAAVSDAVHALAQSDWQKLISLAPPSEIPVYDYRAALVQLSKDSKTSFTIDSLDTTSTVTGDTAKVKLKASGTTDSGDKWSVDGSCFTGDDGLSSSGLSSSGLSSGGLSSGGLSSGGLSSGGLSSGGLSSGDGFEPGLSDAPAALTPECGIGTLYLFPGSTDNTGASDAITVVRESGRWFVSPVGTVLDLVDEAIASLNQRELYTLMNVPDLLPPDGAITLGQPLSVPSGGGEVHVYTLAGHAGERLLGLSTTSAPAIEGFTVELRVFTPDGRELENAQSMLDGEALTLPSDATYKVAVTPFYPDAAATLTIWDEAQAPQAAKQPPEPTFIPGPGVTVLPSQGTTATSTPG